MSRVGRSLDLRLAVPAGAAWTAAAALQPAAVRTSALVALVAVVTGAAAAARRRLVPAAAALGVAAGALAMALADAHLRTGPVAALARSSATATLDLTLVRDPARITTAAGHRLVVVDATATAVRPAAAGGLGGWRADHAPVVVFAVAGRWLGLLPGQRVEVTGRLRPPRSGDTVAAVVLVDETPRTIGRPPVWQRWAGRVRDGLRQACGGLGADQRGLVPGLVLGDVAMMPPDLTADFRVTGLTHLNAVSGANLAIVVGAVAAVVRRLGAGRRFRTWLAGAALVAFVVLVRPSPSVLRAAVMGAVVLVAALVGRRTQAVPVLSAAILLLVLVDPFLARTPGFALSVLATAAIVVVAPPWTERLASVLPRPLAAAVAVPAAAQLACTPVIVAVFGQLSPLAVPANLLAAPAVAPTTLLGVGAALAAPLSGEVAGLLARLAGVPAGWLAVVARTLAAAPGAGLGWPTGVRGLLLLAAAAVAAGLAVRVVRRRRRAILDRCRP